MTPTTPPQEPPDPCKPSRQGQGGGPKTPFGKEASSKNSTTHGLSARFRLKNHFQERVHERMDWYVPRYQPQDDDDTFLCSLAAIGYTQHREAMGEAYQYLAVRSQRAILYWNVDRLVDAALLGARLSKRPEVVAPQLASTLHGARWLLLRWGHLRSFLETTGLWFEDQVALAHDLLGFDAEVRKSDPMRLEKGTQEERLAVVVAEMKRLETLTEGEYLEHDRFLRTQAIAGDGYLDDPAYRRFLRYGRQGQLLNERSLKELERRRIARDLPAYEPNGKLLAPVDPPGTPPRPAPEPLPEDQVVYYEVAPGTRHDRLDQDQDQEREEAKAKAKAEPPVQPYRRPEPRPVPKATPMAPTMADRPPVGPDERRQRADAARQRQEADREAKRRDKAQAKAERKAVKAARVRSRHR